MVVSGYCSLVHSSKKERTQKPAPSPKKKEHQRKGIIIARDMNKNGIPWFVM